jgi:hypothetical protein
MPRDGAIIFSDLIGKLDLLRIEGTKCGRSGQYRLADLITRYGWDGRVFAFTADVTTNCARKQARSDSDPCDAIFPDLTKVVSVNLRDLLRLGEYDDDRNSTFTDVSTSGTRRSPQWMGVVGSEGSQPRLLPAGGPRRALARRPPSGTRARRARRRAFCDKRQSEVWRNPSSVNLSSSFVSGVACKHTI